MASNICRGARAGGNGLRALAAAAATQARWGSGMRGKSAAQAAWKGISVFMGEFAAGFARKGAKGLKGSL